MENTFNINESEMENIVKTVVSEYQKPKKSVVEVYFPHRGTSWSYYNDSFDLKVGDFVYVDGKLEGYRGRVEEVNYSFKIKLSDYKKVIARIDTYVRGDIYLADSHVVTFDRNAIPYSKVITWFKSPVSGEDYVTGCGDDEFSFPLDDLSKMKISHSIAERGYDYYWENRVSFIELDGSQGRAIVKGTEAYEVDFTYTDGKISALRCTCFCSGTCKHGFATMLQLKDSLELITKNYSHEYGDYFAIMSKEVFVNTVLSKKVSGKIRLGV